MSAFTQITYVSRRAIALAPDDADAQVGDILSFARSANPRQGVTGALLSSTDCFAQILEGPTQTVQSLYDRIRVDPRHHDVVLLSSRTVSDRSFADWSMGFAATSGDDEIASTAHLLERAFAAPQGGEASDVADAVRDLIQARISLASIW